MFPKSHGEKELNAPASLAPRGFAAPLLLREQTLWADSRLSQAAQHRGQAPALPAGARVLPPSFPSPVGLVCPMPGQGGHPREQHPPSCAPRQPRAGSGRR